MILKELDPFHGGSPLDVAGRKAEETMAFYLRRAFADNPKVFVLNGIRIEHEGEIAQIDHFLIYPEGFLIVESKSVTTQIKINSVGEWARLWDGAWRGMPSPLEQAKLQFQLLRKKLDLNRNNLLGKFAFIQKGFGGFEKNVVVAVSDSGIVERPSSDSYPNVLKADMVTEYLKELMAHHEKLSTFRSFLKNPAGEITISYPRDDILRTAAFLQKSHIPTSATVGVTTATLVHPGEKVESSTTIYAKPGTGTKGYFCNSCKRAISLKVARFCWGNKQKFGGGAYCMDCQKKF